MEEQPTGEAEPSTESKETTNDSSTQEQREEDVNELDNQQEGSTNALHNTQHENNQDHLAQESDIEDSDGQTRPKKAIVGLSIPAVPFEPEPDADTEAVNPDSQNELDNATQKVQGSAQSELNTTHMEHTSEAVVHPLTVLQEEHTKENSPQEDVEKTVLDEKAPGYTVAPTEAEKVAENLILGFDTKGNVEDDGAPQDSEFMQANEAPEHREDRPAEDPSKLPTAGIKEEGEEEEQEDESREDLDPAISGMS
jgi:hypothetical protein